MWKSKARFFLTFRSANLINILIFATFFTKPFPNPHTLTHIMTPDCHAIGSPAPRPLRPFFSILMPIFNAEQFLAESIGSVLAQTWTDWELICFNDASTDRSYGILQQIAASDARIRIIDSAVNVKQGGGRNRALDASTGRFIIYLDADDRLRSDTLRLIHDRISQQGADLVIFDLMTFIPSQGIEKPFSSLGVIDPAISAAELRRTIARRQTSICSCAYSRDIFERTRLRFPEGVFYEDNAIAMALQLSARNPVKINEPLYYYRNDNASVTRSMDNYRFFDRINSAETLMAHLRRLGIYHEFPLELDNVFINQYYVHTVMGAIYRFSRLPIERIRQVRAGIRQAIPDFRKNPFYRTLPLSRRMKIEIHARFPRIVHTLVKLKRSLTAHS